MSFYRFLNNPQVQLSEVIENQIQKTKLNEMDGHLLVISDTTSINLDRHLGEVVSNVVATNL